MVLWFYGLSLPKYNFDIMDFFGKNAKEKMERFIVSRGLTVNNRLDEFLDIVYQMNKAYLDEYKWLKEMCMKAIQNEDRKINLSLHQQAFIMTWMMQLGYKFRLMPVATNTNMFMKFLEE